MSLRTVIFMLGLALAAPVTSANAQVSPDEAIKKILRTIDEELEEIDRLLLQSRKEPGGDARSAADIEKLMKETQGSQKRVVRGIDQLIEELQKMQSSGSGSGSGNPQGQPQRSDDPLENQDQSTRQENETREQQAPKPGQQQQGKQDQAKNDQRDPKNGKNTKQGQRAEDEEERVIRDADRAKWGNLPQYKLPKHLRGGLPEVPEKYRRFLEAYQRTNQRSNNSSSGGSNNRGNRRR